MVPDPTDAATGEPAGTPNDVQLSDATIAEARAKLAYLESLAAVNTTVKGWIVPASKSAAVQRPEPDDLTAAQAADKKTTEEIVIISHGNICYQVVGHAPRGLEDAEDAVLSPFLKTPAMTESTLSAESGNSRPGLVLRKIADRYPEFAAAIYFPGVKNAGGFRVAVRQADARS
jgi:hypothetical protein